MTGQLNEETQESKEIEFYVIGKTKLGIHVTVFGQPVNKIPSALSSRTPSP